MKILITGATGFVGKKLIKKLIDEGHELNILTRDTEKAKSILGSKNINFFPWKSNFELPPIQAFSQIDGVVHLMGENIGASRWSTTQKKILSSSRVDTTKNLVQVILNYKIPINFFISAGAIGIYPSNLVDILDEYSNLGESYLAKLCYEWEQASSTLNSITRRVIIRTGVVLDKSDGALKKMLPPFKLGLGGPIGNGKQMMSWIQIDDLVNVYLNAITNSNYDGAYNACSPNPVSNQDFTRALGEVLHRPAVLPVPKLAIKSIFGEMSCIILDSQAITSKRLNDENFSFEYANIKLALHKIFKLPDKDEDEY